MKWKWFSEINTLSDLRNMYKQLLFQYHPDNNPDTDTTAIMQEINSEYDTLLKQFAANQPDFQFSEEKEEELKKVLSEVIKLKADILVELIGTWIWVGGNTYAIKNKLKALGFRWNKKRNMWSWGEAKRIYTVHLTMEDIRAKYGSVVYRQPQDGHAAVVNNYN